MNTCAWVTKCWAGPSDETEVELCDEPATQRVSGKWYCGDHFENLGKYWLPRDYSDPHDDRCNECGWNLFFCVCVLSETE